MSAVWGEPTAVASRRWVNAILLLFLFHSRQYVYRVHCTQRRMVEHAHTISGMELILCTIYVYSRLHSNNELIEICESGIKCYFEHQKYNFSLNMEMVWRQIFVHKYWEGTRKSNDPNVQILLYLGTSTGYDIRILHFPQRFKRPLLIQCTANARVHNEPQPYRLNANKTHGDRSAADTCERTQRTHTHTYIHVLSLRTNSTRTFRGHIHHSHHGCTMVRMCICIFFPSLSRKTHT